MSAPAAMGSRPVSSRPAPPSPRARRGARAAALLVPAILLAGSMVLADRPRVLLLGPSPSHPMVTRVRDELAVLGFEVRVELSTGDPDELDAAAHRTGAAAVARIAATPPVIDLWVAGDASAPTTESLRAPADPGLLALRAVELLRARLLPVPSVELPSPSSSPLPSASPVASAPPSASASAPAPRDVAPLPRPSREVAPAGRPPRGPFALLVGPALLASPGGVPAAFHVRLGAEWSPIPRFGFALTAFIPTAASAVTAAEGTVDLRVLDLGGGLRGVLTDPASDLSIALDLGLQAMMLSFDGRAAAPLTGASGSRWAASPYLGASGGYRFHPRLAVRLDLFAALVRPEPVIRIAGRDAASFGQPAVFSSLGLEVRP